MSDAGLVRLITVAGAIVILILMLPLGPETFLAQDFTGAALLAVPLVCGLLCRVLVSPELRQNPRLLIALPFATVAVVSMFVVQTEPARWLPAALVLMVLNAISYRGVWPSSSRESKRHQRS